MNADYFTNKAEIILDHLYNTARDTIVTGHCKASDGATIWVQVARKAGKAVYNLACEGEWFVTSDFDSAVHALQGAL